MSIPCPIRTIGCPDFIMMARTKLHGPLRRRTKLNELVDKVLQIINWRQNYAVLHGGCLYFFADVTKPSAYMAVSLYGFVDCTVCCQGNLQATVLWSFKVQNGLNDHKSIYLSAPSKSQMQSWINKIKEEIVSINSVLKSVPNLPSTTEPEDSNSDYDSVDEATVERESQQNSYQAYSSRPIFPPKTSENKTKKQVKTSQKPVKTSQKPVKTLQEPVKTLQEPVETSQKPVKTLQRPVPKKKTPIVASKPKPPPVPEKPKPVNVVVPSRSNLVIETSPVKEPPEEDDLDYELNQPEGFWSGTNEDGQKMLATQVAGTFFVRHSKNPQTYPLTLVVKCEHATMKKYHIFHTSNRYQLETVSPSGETFPMVNHLLNHFKHHPMPSHDGGVYLKHPYTAFM